MVKLPSLLQAPHGRRRLRVPGVPVGPIRANLPVTANGGAAKLALHRHPSGCKPRMGGAYEVLVFDCVAITVGLSVSVGKGWYLEGGSSPGTSTPYPRRSSTKAGRVVFMYASAM